MACALSVSVAMFVVASASASAPPSASAETAADGAPCAAPVAAVAAAQRNEPFVPTGRIRQSRAVTLLFLPAPIRTPTPVLTADLLRLPDFAVGLFSPTIGRYSPAQMMLDISQGSRAASAQFRPSAPPVPGLIVDPRTQTGRFTEWRALLRRADTAPADVTPGLLGCAAERSGHHVAWVGAEGASTATAMAAVAGGGAIRRAEVVPPRSLVDSIGRLQRDFAVVVAELPPGGFGLGAVRRLAAATPERMIVVVQAPPNPARTRLLGIAVRGIGGRGGLRSASTRRAGLVAATDIGATVLERIGAERPKTMQGRPIEPAGRMDADELRGMAARLELIAGRRLPFGKDVTFLYVLLIAVALALGGIAGRRTEIWATTRRVVGLSLLWLPALLLLTAALRPSRAVEVDVAVFGSVGLALVTDRLVPWPRGPWPPVAAVLAVYAADFALLGSRFTGQSLLGSNPLYGARFFGAGNELEAVFTVSALLCAGAFMCDRRVARPARAFAVAGVAMAMFLGLGRLGADVGGVVMVGVGFGVAAMYAARMRVTPLRLVLLALLPLAGIALVAAIDAVTGGESHLTRTFQDAGGAGDIWTVIDRRFRASVAGARADGVWIIVMIACCLLAWGWLRRARLLAPLTGAGEDAAARRPYRAALAGGTAATVAGALANDSGPAILIIGTIYLLTGVIYLRGRPPDV